MVPFARYQSGCNTQHLHSRRPVEPVRVQQPGDPRLHWMPIAVDGPSRHEASYVHCTLGATISPNQLASWWLLGGREEWATLYVAAQEVGFDQLLWDVSQGVFQDTRGFDWEILFWLCADGKAQFLMANSKNWKAEAPQASVCWVCGCSRAQCLTDFGLEDTIDGWWEVALATGAIYRHIAGDRRIPDYGLHGVLCVTLCGISGMRDVVAATTGKSAAVVVRNLLQPILDVAYIQAKTVTKGMLNNDKANGKGKVRLECAAAVQFMRTRWWEALITMCLE